MRNSKNPRGRRWNAFEQAVALLLVATFVGVLANYGALVEGTLLAGSPDADAPWEVSPVSLEEDLHWGRSVVVDTRSRPAYEQAHIPGSIWLDVSRAEEHLAWLSDLIPPDALVAVVSPKPVLEAHADLRRLQSLGLTELRLLAGGVDGWRSKGGVVVSGWDMEPLLEGRQP